MMKRYMHIERFGNDEVEGIEDGRCYIFPKLDGTSGSVWSMHGELQAGSRNRHLSLDNDNQGFLEYASTHQGLNKWILEKSNLRLFGEWLVPHSLKTYEDSAWKKFYIFDVYDDDADKFLWYHEYKPLLEEYELDYIPAMSTIVNGNQSNFIKETKNNKFLIKDGEGIGEGVVIKNYDYVNKYGRTIWAKVVTNSFKEKNIKEMGGTDKVFKSSIEQNIISKHITPHFVDKTFNKIKDENDWSSEKIPYLINLCYHDLVKEEMWDIIKKNKNPTINYKILHRLMISEIKRIKPELF